MNSKQQATQAADPGSQQSHSTEAKGDVSKPAAAKLPKTERDRAGSARKNDQPSSAPESGDKSP